MKNKLSNIFFFWLGLFILCANKIRYAFTGYIKPRPFSKEDAARSVAYDTRVVENWVAFGRKHFGNDFSFTGQNILELGPGDDLGTGIMMLSSKADHYYAFDKNPLALDSTKNLLPLFEEQGVLNSHELLDTIEYRIDPEFNIGWYQNKNITLVVSNAAFEHFDSLETTFRELGAILPAGAKIILEVDLQTHTGVIKDPDPLNIYRYPQWLYQKLHFTGIPNRRRPAEYKNLLEETGFENIGLYPENVLAVEKLKKVQTSLHASFQKDYYLHWLSFVICATKK